MSEQARLNLLKKRLDKIIDKRKIGTVLTLCVATAISMVSIIYGFDFLYGFDFVTGLFLWVICVTAVVWLVQNYYDKQENAIMWQIEQIEQLTTVIPKCPSCEKEIPQADSYFCPFCGNSLSKVDVEIKIDDH